MELLRPNCMHHRVRMRVTGILLNNMKSWKKRWNQTHQLCHQLFVKLKQCILMERNNIANVYMDEANFDIKNLIVCWLMLKKRKYKFLRLENQNFFFSLSLVSRKKLFIKTFLLQRIYVFHLLDG